MERVQGSSAWSATQLLRSNVVELRPSQFSLRLRERAISKSDIIIIIIIIIVVIIIIVIIIIINDVHTFKIFLLKIIPAILPASSRSQKCHFGFRRCFPI